MRGPKAPGERIAARGPGSQTTGIHLCIALMNCFYALCAAEILRVA